MTSAVLSVLSIGALPLALDSESVSEATGNGTAIAIIALVSMIACYLLLFALWRYVFSAKAKAKRNEPPD
jgi:hypothetical protein